ncbi:type II toxin-antitoxin system PemK/MazF family toxin [Candidatus Saccharibacteria bacterium]|nr:type II toxin-antitoxin system PemK/MazF family toxin [Candidatus Saccharibacteria bacterium]
MNKNGKKDFNGWIKLKRQLHYDGKLRAIKDGDIWWCAVGENVGAEICGKGKTFARPVLVIRKLSKYNFIGVPLTSKKHKGSWYVEFVFCKVNQTAVVSQAENISVYRLYNKVGIVPESDLQLVRDSLCSLVLGK